MFQNKLGAYFCNTHDRAENWEYIQAMQPVAIRLLDPSVSLIKRVYDLLPQTIIYPRYWSISENQAEYQSNPIGLANQHIEFWKNTIQQYEQNGMKRERFVTVSQNEPKIWSDINRKTDYDAWSADMEKVYQCNLDYNLTLANGLGKEKIKSTLIGAAVGHPTNLKDGEPPYWGWAYRLVEPTLKFGHEWELHEYWSSQNLQQNWGWWAGRWQHIPFDVPIIIGECGIDRYVNEPGVSQQQRGWQSKVNAKEYAIQLNSYAAHLDLDKRVIACFPFLTDYANNQWQSFDTLPARKEIIGERNVKYETYLPIVTTPGEKPVEPVESGCRLKWPPLKPITQFFGGDHEGLDVGLPEGTPIYAIYDGEVAWSDIDKPPPVGGYGEYIRLWHPALKVHSFYAHLSRRVVSQGQKVKKGELIAYSGNTGNSSGPHCHYEIRLADEKGNYLENVSSFSNGRVDPLTYFYALGAFGHD